MELATQHKVIIAIQARLSSARCPGKVLRPFCGMPMLAFQVRRLNVNTFAPVVILTPERDAAIIQEALGKTFSVYASPCDENDVLGRYAEFSRTMLMAPEDTIVRITGDCPLLCPYLLRQVYYHYRDHKDCILDYCGMGQGWPDGLGDIDVIRVRALWDADARASDAPDREHVAPWLWRQPQVYPQSVFPFPEHWRGSWPQLSVDIADDLCYAERVIQEIARRWAYADSVPLTFNWEDVLRTVRETPALHREVGIMNGGYMAQLANSAASWGEVRYGGVAISSRGERGSLQAPPPRSSFG